MVLTPKTTDREAAPVPVVRPVYRTLVLRLAVLTEITPEPRFVFISRPGVILFVTSRILQ